MIYPSYLQRNNNNFINYIIHLYIYVNAFGLFFNFNLLGKSSFIFYKWHFTPVTD